MSSTPLHPLTPPGGVIKLGWKYDDLFDRPLFGWARAARICSERRESASPRHCWTGFNREIIARFAFALLATPERPTIFQTIRAERSFRYVCR